MKHKRIVYIILIIFVGCMLIFLSKYQHTSSKRLEDKSPIQIEIFKSSIDADNDGIDDQTDILQGALDYILTQPKYKSKYYMTGYSNDKYGVCTDVVVNACLSAGYDLMKLMQKDIEAYPEDYNIENPDSNIDFRRVKNLKVYLQNNAITLTTDVRDYTEWQGGDIVIFEKHIGVISDRRNANKIPYVIHHNGPYQKTYEEDILQQRKDVVGHYRISE